MPATVLLSTLLGFVPALAGAQDEAQVFAGPGRIVCNATFCELALESPTHPRLRVIVSGLPKEDTGRLRKCTGVAAPCIVSIEGTRQEHPYRILATTIKWQE